MKRNVITGPPAARRRQCNIYLESEVEESEDASAIGCGYVDQLKDNLLRLVSCGITGKRSIGMQFAKVYEYE